MRYASYIDHTLLKPESTDCEITNLCNEAKKYNFASVCVNPCNVLLCHSSLKNSPIKICTVIGFPLGSNTTETKIFETKDAIKKGATEIDMVLNIGWLKQNKMQEVMDEIKSIKEACGTDIVLKVIIETCLLTQEEKILACKCVSKARADYIKTSTGFSTSGATLEDVVLLRKHTHSSIGVKASGGVKNINDVKQMIDAGATRIGTSRGVEMMTNHEDTKCKY